MTKRKLKYKAKDIFLITNLGRLFLLIICFFLFFNTFLGAQIIQDTIAVEIDTSLNSSVIENSILEIDSIGVAKDSIQNDSTKVNQKTKLKNRVKRPKITFKDSSSIYFTKSLTSYIIKYIDTSLNDRVMEEDAKRHFSSVSLGNGNIGSSSTPLVFRIKNKIDNDIGLHQYDLYNMPKDSFRYFIVQKPYTNAYFKTGLDKNNFSNGIQFANQYENGFSLNVTFDRINQVGIYNSQKTKHSDLNTAVQWDNNRHKLYLHYYYRSNTEEHNGGIIHGQDLSLTELNIRTNVPTYLSGSASRHFLTGFKMTNKYLLLEKSNHIFDLYHELNFDHLTYKFYDENISTNESYYKSLAVDERGIRFYLDKKIWKNNVGFIVSHENNYFLNAGISFQNDRIDQDSYGSSLNILNLTGKGMLKIGRWLNYGNLNFNIFGLDNNSLLDIKSKFVFNKKYGTLMFNYANVRFSPSFIQKNYYLNDQVIWKNDFHTQVNNSISVGYKNSFTKTKIELKQIILTDQILLDSTINFKQYNGLIDISQLIIEQGFKLWKFNSSNKAIFQRSPTIIGLPKFHSFHDLYFEHKFKTWYKVLRIGGNLRYFSSNNLLAFQPALGGFYPTDNPFEDYWTSDVYISMKISKTRFYIKYYNWNHNSFINDNVNYLILNQPQFDSQVLFGVEMRLYD